ncbi:MAG: type II toxin-antitoxin system mRNA interferase toxin, RelE/StbE family [Candidatus Woesebacteria bacterium]|jgi:addiction module RelE/StbE family toxin
MQVRLHKTFSKQYANLKPTQQKRLKQAFELFMVDPFHPDLYNHPLSGEWTGYRSIAFGGDWRAHYKQTDDTAIFVAVGTHSQLYK